MRRLLAGISIMGLIAGLVVTGLAVAGGGDSIASAPDVPLGVSQVASRDGIDYWRVNVNTGDLLIVDFGSVDGDPVALCLWQPAVSDYTSATTRCERFIFTTRKAELTFRPGPSGKWILAFLDSTRDWDCVSARIGPSSWFPSENELYSPASWLTVEVDPKCRGNVSYEFAAYVKRYTSTTLRGSAIVRSNSVVTLRGRVEGVSGGQVQIQFYYRGAWQTDARVVAGAGGAFVYRFRAGRLQRGYFYNVRAVYPGDSEHLASESTSIKIRTR